MTNRKQFQFFPFHLVDMSPWPLLTSFSVLLMAVSAVMSFHGFANGGKLLLFGFILTASVMLLWFKDVVTEGTYLGDHTTQVRRGLTIGFVLFVISEVFAFLSIFWAFFHSSLAPDITIGATWPPMGIVALDPFAVPLLNTVLLLSSGVSQKCTIYDLIFFTCTVLPFSSPREKSIKRIGPHNYDILSLVIGSLLGDGSMEKCSNGSRFVYYQAKINGEYLLWLHNVISNLGYAKKELPKLYSRKGSLLAGIDEIRYYYRFRTFTFSSFDWIYDSFYPNRSRKVIPNFIDIYLSPLALAVWMMDDGTSYKNKGFKFSTNSFTLKEIHYLALVLKNKYSIDSTIHKSGLNNQYNIYIPKSSFNTLKKIVTPHFHPTMMYKINNF